MHEQRSLVLSPWLVSWLGLLVLLLFPVSARAQTGTIAGTITSDASGEPIPGVNVLVDGTTRGAATGPDGQYAITDVEPGTYTVVASFIGYGDESEAYVTVAAGETTTVDITMQQQAAGLDEVVVVGYGEQQREDLTGSVSSVSAEDLQSAPTASVEQGLQGRVAGVQVTQASGQPGAGSTVRIRGTASIQGGNEPLYVVDGVPIANVGGAGALGAGANSSNPLATLNTSDIASIEVLKDASATAIYGSRGANGVILITTKRGQGDQNRISFETSYGWEQVRNPYELLNARQFAELANEAAANANAQPIFSEEEVSSFGGGTDWQEEIFRTAPTQNYQLSFSGSSDDTQYFLSGNYSNQQGVVIGSSFRRGTFRANVDRDFGEAFQLRNTLTLSRTDADALQESGGGGIGGTNSSVVFGALQSPPTIPVRDAAGNYTLGTHPVTGRPFANPVAAARDITNDDVKDRIIGNLTGEYEITEELTAEVSAGIDYFNNHQEYYAPRTVPPGSVQNGVARIGDTQTLTWLNENTLNYSDVFEERHSLDLLVGATFQGTRTQSSLSSAEDFPNDVLRQNALETAAQLVAPSSGRIEYGLVSYLSRANYELDGKYLLTLSGRVDGSSRFGEDNKYGFFPSGAVAWRLSEEPFLQDLDFLSNLKLRASYGQTGNQEIGVYQSLATLGSGTYIYGGRRAIGYGPSNISNPDLKWEKTDQLDLGFDLGLFGNRLALTADYYYKKTTDLLLNVDVPYTSGFASSLQNIGAVRNQGVELALNTVNVTGPFEWQTDFNIAFNRNEVLDLGDKEQIISAGPSVGRLDPTLLQEGEPIGTFYGVRFAGIENGQITFEDRNDDGVITGADRTVIGDAQPDYTGGLTNRFSYGNFDLSVFLQWTVGGDIYNALRETLYSAGAQTNGVRETINRPTDLIPAAQLGNRITRDSDYFVEDGSYLRGKNIRLTYSLPTADLGFDGIVRNLNFYVSAQNFFTITDYSGFDPEVSEYGQATLGQGIDRGVYPQTHQLTVGASIGL